MNLEETKYCKYCNNELKKIVYEIIEPDKSNNFERYYCKKCIRVFHFRELSPKKTKKTVYQKEKKTKKFTNKKGKK